MNVQTVFLTNQIGFVNGWVGRTVKVSETETAM